MASKVKALMTEVRWRGFWGTIRAVKTHNMGTMNCFVGEDTFKNRFFEDKSKSFGRHRWVDYIDGSTPDSSKITPEWHAWLHHNIDALPSKHPLPEPAYKIPATGNRTGTRDAYVPSHHRLNSNFHGRANEKYESWKQPTPTTGTGSGSKAKESDVDVLDLK